MQANLDTLAAKYDRAVVYIHWWEFALPFFFFGDPDWLDQRWTRPMFAEVGARVTWGFGVGFGVVPAWLTFKTKPSGCSQAPYTGCRRIGRYSLRLKIWPTVYYPRSLICFATGVRRRGVLPLSFANTLASRNYISRLTLAYLKLSSFFDKWRLCTFQKSCFHRTLFTHDKIIISLVITQKFMLLFCEIL